MDVSSGPTTLYLKAGPDGTSVGDCPFAHYVQIVLHEKQVPFTARPTTKESKPKWLIDNYGGSMPALQCGDDEICIVESDVIAKFVDESVTAPPHLASGNFTAEEMEAASECTNGFFPAVARYLKYIVNGDEEDLKRKAALEEALGKIEAQLGRREKIGPFLAGNGESITLLDCSLIPKLYHLSAGIKGFKDDSVTIENQFPLVYAYMKNLFDRDSFKKSFYPEATIIWGWSKARES